MHTQPNSISYKPTILACYIGNFVQAILINLTPILFIPLREQYGFSYEQLGLLILINFTTQVLVDLAFSGLVDKYGFRRFIVAAHGFAAAGLLLFAVAPLLFPATPYFGFALATVVFSCGGGLLELLLSPIVNAIPTDEKATAMAVLHSFYAWGQVAVVLLTTLLLFLLGRTEWPWILVAWTLMPLVNLVLFSFVPLAPPIPEDQRMGLGALVRTRYFVVAVLAILFGGAAEVTMAQWTSAFAERALNLPKVVGDVAGVALFAAMLGFGRVLYSIFGQRVSVNRVMMGGAIMAACCFVVAALSPVNLIALLACVLCGLATSLLWPGALVLAAERFPLAGAGMFAIMAAGGDVGAAAGPWLVGVVTDHVPGLPVVGGLVSATGLQSEQFGLRAGLLVGTIFPLVAYACLRWMRGHRTAD
ncbi:MAG: fucose permease [Symbiobacteriaceae bacterium]|jgi:fucose permease|nr:fucose permease [Symbiobacteriaceae bacterium]